MLLVIVNSSVSMTLVPLPNCCMFYDVAKASAINIFCEINLICYFWEQSDLVARTHNNVMLTSLLHKINFIHGSPKRKICVCVVLFMSFSLSLFGKNYQFWHTLRILQVKNGFHLCIAPHFLSHTHTLHKHTGTHRKYTFLIICWGILNSQL